MAACELSIVIPAYCEEAHLAATLDAVCRHADAASSSFEVIVVDDGSPDRTWRAICEAGARHPQVRGVRLARRFGKEGALFAGLSQCRGAAAITMDADLQHPAELIGRFAGIWRSSQAKVVQAVKQDHGSEPLFRRGFSALYNAFASRLTGIRFQSSTDFKLLDREVLDALLAMPENRTFYRGMVAWLGFETVDVPFRVAPRAHGRSKFGLVDLIGLAWHSVPSYSDVPLRIIHVIAAVFLLFGAALGVWALYLKFAGIALSGFTTVITLQLLIGGLVLFCLALIAEYLAAVYGEVKRRPRYVIAQRTPSPGPHFD